MSCGQSSTDRRQDSGQRFAWNTSAINLDLNSITEALNPRNISANFEDLMASVRCGSRIKDTTCQSCGFKFTLLKRKRTCHDCNMDFCSPCLNKEVRYDRHNHCKRCVVFNSVPLDRNALNGLRARDLKWFLAAKRVPSQMCNEKSELVDLILAQFAPQNANASNSGQFERRFDNYTSSSRRSDASIPEVVDIDDENVSSQPNVPPIPPPNEPLATNEIPHEEQKEDISKIYFSVDDIKSVDQLRTLSIKQLKLILTRNFIDYRGCVEREELLDKAERLWNDRQENRQNIDDIPDHNLCKICMENAIDCVLLECGHVVACTECGKRLNECPICRQYVIRVVHIFKS